MDKTEWMADLDKAYTLERQAPWLVADIMVTGLDTFCHNRNDVANLYDEVSEQLEVARTTLMNYASVARKFPPHMRRQRLSLGHHVVVLGLDDSEAEYWLDQAEAGGWSIGKLQAEMRSTPEEREYSVPAEVLPALCSGVRRVFFYPNEAVFYANGVAVRVKSRSQLDWRIE